MVDLRTISFPVYALASFTADVVAFEPFLANLTISALGICCCIISASTNDGRIKLHP